MSLKCSVRDANSAVNLNVYLCKNGVGDRMEKLTDGEASFTLTNVTLQDTGNYSCVYTHRKLKYNEVNSTGEYSIFIRIQSSLGTSQSMPGTPTNTKLWLKLTGSCSPFSKRVFLISVTIPDLTRDQLNSGNLFCS